MSDESVKNELGLGDVISRTFKIYQDHFVEYFVLFAVVGVIIGIVTAVARAVIAVPTAPVNPTPQQSLDFFYSFLGAVIPEFFLILVASLILSPLAEGGGMLLASGQIEGGTPSIGSSVRGAASRIFSIWVLGLVVGIIVVLGFIALIIPGIILAIMFSLALPVLLIEKKGVFESMSRSRQLVGGRWLSTFATFLVLGIIVVIISVVVGAISGIFGAASPIVSGLLQGFYAPLVPIGLVLWYYSNVARLTPAPAAMAPQTMMTKYCPNCGTQVDSAAAFCPKCGSKL